MPPNPPRRSRLLLPVAAAILLVFGAFWTTSYVFLTEPPPPPETDPLSRLRPVDAESDVTPSPPPTARPTQGPVTSVLHPRAAFLPALTAGQQPEVRPESSAAADIVQWTEYFPQHGEPQRGVHWRLQNRRVLAQTSQKAHDAVLLLVVLKDHRSYGLNRSSADLFALLATFTVPKAKVSLTVLVSDMQEFDAVQRNMHRHIAEYAQFSLLFRSDFNARGLTRENRHDTGIQNERRRLLARYRNFALLSTLETWHQHVVWLDADVERVPAHLVAKMMRSGLDIVEPICYRDDAEYDRNAWVGTRTKPKDASDREGFVPMGLRDRHMIDYRDGDQEFIPLDSVGGTMLYVKADIHRQGVLFTHHYVIGSEWDQEGYDGIETEGLCYEAHFFGYKCWGMPREAIHHTEIAERLVYLPTASFEWEVWYHLVIPPELAAAPPAPTDRFILFLDGGSRGNAGPGGAGAVIVRTDCSAATSTIIWSAAMSLAAPTTTNNQAEHTGLLTGIRAASAHAWTPLEVVGDRMRILRQVSRYRPPRNVRLRQLYDDSPIAWG